MSSKESIEKEVEVFEKALSEMERLGDDNEKVREEIEKLRKKISELQKEILSQLNPWQRTKLARHENRPYSLDYIKRLFTDFEEIHGDRKYADDPAIVAGFCFYKGTPVVVIGQQKGRNLKERQFRNFGMPQPEGYRKAIRVMKMAEKFGKPIITFIDTPGAYPGVGAEERGQAEAIAYNLREMAKLRVPIISNVIGEGGSGGALGIGVSNRILMLENAIYSVISPESCSAILWKDQEHAKEAAENLKLTSSDLLKFGIIDEIVKEPEGGAHKDHDKAANLLDEVLEKHLKELQNMSADELIEDRYRKFRKMGVVSGE